jgi:hypothetical protein
MASPPDQELSPAVPGRGDRGEGGVIFPKCAAAVFPSLMGRGGEGVILLVTLSPVLP